MWALLVAFVARFIFLGLGGLLLGLLLVGFLFIHDDDDDAKDAWDEIFHLLVGFELFFTYSP